MLLSVFPVNGFHSNSPSHHGEYSHNSLVRKSSSEPQVKLTHFQSFLKKKKDQKNLRTEIPGPVWYGCLPPSCKLYAFVKLFKTFVAFCIFSEFMQEVLKPIGYFSGITLPVTNTGSSIFIAIVMFSSLLQVSLYAIDIWQRGFRI